MKRDFYSRYRHDFVRIATCVPRTQVADTISNVDETIRLAREGHTRKAALMLFPELDLASYAIDDLLFQDALLDGVEKVIEQLIESSRQLYPVFVVGAPLRHEGRLFNAAVALHRGRILGVVPKTYLPNYREFSERGPFHPGAGTRL